MQANIDSLLLTLGKMKDDTLKVRMLGAISQASSTLDPKQGLIYAQQALALAQKINWPRGITASYSFLGKSYFYNANYPMALQYDFLYLNRCKENNFKPGEEVALQSLGTVYTKMGDPAKGLDYQLQALQVCEEMGSKKELKTQLANVGNAYHGLHNNIKALEYDDKALNLSNELADSTAIAINLGNLGNIYEEEKQYGKAIAYETKALRLCENIANEHGIAINLGNIGICYVHLATDTVNAIVPGDMISPGRGANLDKGIEYLTKSITIAHKIGLLAAIIPFTEALGDAYKAKGDRKNALETYTRYWQLKDSLFSSANSQKIKQLENKQALDLKEKDIQLAHLEVLANKQDKIFYISGIVALLMITSLMLRNNRAQRKAYKLLGAEKTLSDRLTLSLEGTLLQKEMLVKEVHHRVKNNLEVISNMLQLQSDGLNNAQARDAIAEGQGRVRSIGLIHQKLYQGADITTIELKGFLQDLYTQVTGVFQPRNQQISVQFHVAETVLDIDTAIPLGLIINELLSNAFKYAFTPAREGLLSISLSRQAAYYVLVVKDNGPGLPAGQDLTSFSSLGMRLVALLSQQLGGHTNYAYDSGSTFSIYFKESLEIKKTL